MIERRDLHLHGLRLSYLERGTAVSSKPTLLLIHGLMGCAATFVPFMQSCLPGQHVLALDLPGAGASERRSDIDASLGANSLHIARFIKALHLDRPTVLGHSHGGSVAMGLACIHPELLTSLILLAPAHPYFDEGDPLIRFYLSLPGRLFAYSMPWYPAWMQMMGLRRMAGPRSWDTPERLIPYRESLRVPGTMAHLLKLLRTWHDDMAGLRRALRKPLTTPTLIVWGDCDRAVPVHSAQELQNHLLDFSIKVLPGVGHRPAEERPELVAALVAHWLSRSNTETTHYNPYVSDTQPLIAPLSTSSFDPGL